jgi:hypothetical protein
VSGPQIDLGLIDDIELAVPHGTPQLAHGDGFCRHF